MFIEIIYGRCQKEFYRKMMTIKQEWVEKNKQQLKSIVFNHSLTKLERLDAIKSFVLLLWDKIYSIKFKEKKKQVCQHIEPVRNDERLVSLVLEVYKKEFESKEESKLIEKGLERERFVLELLDQELFVQAVMNRASIQCEINSIWNLIYLDDAQFVLEKIEEIVQKKYENLIRNACLSEDWIFSVNSVNEKIKNLEKRLYWFGKFLSGLFGLGLVAVVVLGGVCFYFVAFFQEILLFTIPVAKMWIWLRFSFLCVFEGVLVRWCVNKVVQDIMVNLHVCRLDLSLLSAVEGTEKFFKKR
jgi:hypothetical protein